MIRALLRLSDALRHRGRARQWDKGLAMGRRGEDLAHRLLQREGMTVVARNYRARSGEIDLVAWDGATLVFAEVKSRGSTEFGAPERAVDHEKRQAILRGAGEYARRAGVPWSQVRFDIVSVILSNPPRVTRLADAFRAERAM